MSDGKELLPIGSVVLLAGFEVNGFPKKLMIYARKVTRSGTDDVFDYVACFYPEGFISSAYNVFFNHEDISRIVFRGYEDDEERALRKNL